MLTDADTLDHQVWLEKLKIFLKRYNIYGIFSSKLNDLDKFVDSVCQYLLKYFPTILWR